jgi:hypothetical protein
MHNRIADPETPVDAAARHLHAPGWNNGDVATGGRWLVTGMNGGAMFRWPLMPSERMLSSGRHESRVKSCGNN